MNHTKHSRWFTALLLTTAALATSASAAESVRRVDPSAFDIAGVKLGMSLEEAVEAATKSLGVAKKDVKKSTLVANPVTSKIEVTKFQIRRLPLFE